jgi:hypothetical protein
MFTSIILLLPFLMVVFLPLGLTSFSSTELDEMGIQLDATNTEAVCNAKDIPFTASIIYGIA